MKSWPEKVILAVVVVLAIRYLLYRNPIRFHQTVQVDGLTMQVPVLWAPLKNPGEGILIAVRREWARAGTVDVMDRTVFEALTCYIVGTRCGFLSWGAEDTNRPRAECWLR